MPAPELFEVNLWKRKDEIDNIMAVPDAKNQYLLIFFRVPLSLRIAQK
jgi:hypothetical protein